MCARSVERSRITIRRRRRMTAGLLGCCIPIVGLVLFLVWRDTKPKTSKAAGIGALVSVIVYVLFYVFAAVVGVGVAMY